LSVNFFAFEAIAKCFTIQRVAEEVCHGSASCPVGSGSKIKEEIILFIYILHFPLEKLYTVNTCGPVGKNITSNGPHF
jgi:hypothetical protein